MDTSKITFGELVAVASGLVLLIALFLDWFEGASAWQALNLVDFLLALMALVAMGVALSGAAGVELGLPRAIIAALGAVALVIALTFLFEADDRGLGLFLAVLAAGGLTYGGYAALSEGARRPAAAAPGSRPRPGAAGPSRPGAAGRRPASRPRPADAGAPPGRPPARPQRGPVAPPEGSRGEGGGDPPQPPPS